MIIVVDSNVYIAAFATHGICHLLIEKCLLEHTVPVSDFILGEITEKLSRKIKLPEETLNNILIWLRNSTQYFEIPEGTAPAACRDPDDDNVLQLAVVAGAEFIVTGDKDLLIMNQYQNIKILSPRELAEIFRNMDSST